MIANEKDGVTNMTWPDSIIEQLRGAWDEVLREQVAANPDVAKLCEAIAISTRSIRSGATAAT